MGTPIIAGAGIWKLRQLAGGGAGAFEPAVLAAGVIASAVSGCSPSGSARYLQNHNTDIFVIYRIGAAIVFALLLPALTNAGSAQSGGHGSDQEAATATDPRSDATQNIRTQHELAAALRERGYRATQATISRDVSEMGLIKSNRDEGERGYSVQPRVEQPETSGEERLAMILRDLPVDIRPAGLMIVVRAVPAQRTRSRRRSTAPLAGGRRVHRRRRHRLLSRALTVPRLIGCTGDFSASPRPRSRGRSHTTSAAAVRAVNVCPPVPAGTGMRVPGHSGVAVGRVPDCRGLPRTHCPAARKVDVPFMHARPAVHMPASPTRHDCLGGAGRNYPDPPGAGAAAAAAPSTVQRTV